MKKGFYYLSLIRKILIPTIYVGLFQVAAIECYSLGNSLGATTTNGFDPIIGFLIALTTLFFGYVFEYFMKLRSMQIPTDEKAVDYGKYMHQTNKPDFVPLGNGIWINEVDSEPLLALLSSVTSTMNYIKDNGFLVLNEDGMVSMSGKSITFTSLLVYINNLPVKIIFAFNDTFKNLSIPGDQNVINIQNSKLIILEKGDVDLIGSLILKTIELKYSIDGAVENNGVELTPLYIENKIRDELKLPLKKLTGDNVSNFDFQHENINNSKDNMRVDGFENNNYFDKYENINNLNEYNNSSDLTDDMYSQVSEVFDEKLENDNSNDFKTEYNDEYFSSVNDYDNAVFKADGSSSEWDRASQFEQDFNYSTSVVDSGKSIEGFEKPEVDNYNSNMPNKDYEGFSEFDYSQFEEMDDLDGLDKKDILEGYDNFEREKDPTNEENYDYDFNFDDDDFDDDFDDEELNKLYEEIKNNSMFDDNEDDQEDQTYDDKMYNDILSEYNENMSDGLEQNSQPSLMLTQSQTQQPQQSQAPLDKAPKSSDSIVILANTANGSGGVYKKKDGKGSLKLLESESGVMTFENVAAKPGVYSLVMHYSAMMWSTLDLIVNGQNEIQFEIYGEGNIDKIIKTSVNVPLEKGLNSIQFKNSSYQNILIEKLEFNWVDSIENAGAHIVA